MAESLANLQKGLATFGNPLVIHQANSAIIRFCDPPSSTENGVSGVNRQASGKSGERRIPSVEHPLSFADYPGRAGDFAD